MQLVLVCLLHHCWGMSFHGQRQMKCVASCSAVWRQSAKSTWVVTRMSWSCRGRSGKWIRTNNHGTWAIPAYELHNGLWCSNWLGMWEYVREYISLAHLLCCFVFIEAGHTATLRRCPRPAQFFHRLTCAQLTRCLINELLVHLACSFPLLIFSLPKMCATHALPHHWASRPACLFVPCSKCAQSTRCLITELLVQPARFFPLLKVCTIYTLLISELLHQPACFFPCSKCAQSARYLVTSRSSSLLVFFPC